MVGGTGNWLKKTVVYRCALLEEQEMIGLPTKVTIKQKELLQDLCVKQ